ncbi:hypothetical protein VTK26DRAFT_7947 [Humicola hyalothermophila]
MQRPNKQRQRRIRHSLHKSLPKEGTVEFELWRRNQQLSPLFRLPPELRNRIDELVLSVGQINVCFRNPKPRRPKRDSQLTAATTTTATTTTTIDATSTRGRGFYCRILPRHQNPWRPQRRGDKNNHTTAPPPSPPRGMTLLSPVCRQLYHETVLLPYALNAWSFESRRVMERYVVKEKRLPLPQRRAIRVLYAQGFPPRELVAYLGGLQLVVLESGRVLTRRGRETDRGAEVAWLVSHCIKWE